MVLVILVCGSRRHHVVEVQGRATVRLGHTVEVNFTVLLVGSRSEVWSLRTRVVRLVLSVLHVTRRQPAKTFRYLRLQMGLSRIVIEAVVMRIN